MRKFLCIASAGGAVRISFIALACVFLWATGARADTFTYTYTGQDFTKVSGSYTTSDSVTGQLIFNAALPSNSTLTNVFSLLGSYSFSDGLQTLTNMNSTINNELLIATTNGSITAWSFNIEGVNPLINQQIVTFNEPPNAADTVTNSVDLPPPAFHSHAENSAAGSWTVPEPGTLSMMFSGLLGLGLLVGMKRYRGNCLATEA